MAAYNSSADPMVMATITRAMLQVAVSGPSRSSSLRPFAIGSAIQRGAMDEEQRTIRITWGKDVILTAAPQKGVAPAGR
jgi:hypothetical protein